MGIKSGKILLGAVSLCLFCSCGVWESERAEERLVIVTTTTMITDLAENIAGEAAVVVGLMSPGVDPHLYQASARDAVKLQTADIIIHNGLGLEGKLGLLLEGSGEETIMLSDGIPPESLIKLSDDVYDPHIWFDVGLWREAAAYLCEKLQEYDPENREAYAENLSRYTDELGALETYAEAQFARIPDEKRVLVTAHDAFGYFGAAYGFEIKALQGVSTSAEAAVREISGLAEFIAQREIAAVFTETSLSGKTVSALVEAVAARGFSVGMGGALYSDSLGEGDESDYIGAFRANIDTITGALTKNSLTGE